MNKIVDKRILEKELMVVNEILTFLCYFFKTSAPHPTTQGGVQDTGKMVNSSLKKRVSTLKKMKKEAIEAQRLLFL